MRLSPFDPLTSLWLHFYGTRTLLERKLRVRRSAVADPGCDSRFPTFRQPSNTLIAALGQAGRVDDAQAVMADGLARFGDAFRALMGAARRPARTSQRGS